MNTFQKQIKTNIYAFFIFCVTSNFAQGNLFSENFDQSSIYMTWNKNTPENEMNDDIKTLKQNGVTISYKNVKRNSNGEITSLRVEYKDTEGNQGSQEYNGLKPIAEIKFFKNKKEIGFGVPKNEGVNFGNLNFNEIPKWEENPGMGHSFQFNSDELNGNGKSKMIIKQNGKAPLVIENGEVIEGGEGYTKEEIEEFKKNNKIELGKENGMQNFNFNNQNSDIELLKKKMEEMQKMFQNNNGSFNFEELNNPKKPEISNVKEELKKAKEEMMKAKKEMEEARKELQKAKTEIKMRKA